jgi:amino acid permease
MSKPAAIALILFVVCIMTFATWQLFLGRFEAAFSALPFLIICYFFVKPWKQTQNDPPE